MADRPVNLNKVRKARAKTERRAKADRNAVIHGLPKSCKDQARAEADRLRERQSDGLMLRVAPPPKPSEPET